MFLCYPLFSFRFEKLDSSEFLGLATPPPLQVWGTLPPCPSLFTPLMPVDLSQQFSCQYISSQQISSQQISVQKFSNQQISSQQISNQLILILPLKGAGLLFNFFLVFLVLVLKIENKSFYSTLDSRRLTHILFKNSSNIFNYCNKYVCLVFLEIFYCFFIMYKHDKFLVHHLFS